MKTIFYVSLFDQANIFCHLTQVLRLPVLFRTPHSAPHFIQRGILSLVFNIPTKDTLGLQHFFANRPIVFWFLDSVHVFSPWQAGNQWLSAASTAVVGRSCSRGESTAYRLSRETHCTSSSTRLDPQRSHPPPPTPPHTYPKCQNEIEFKHVECYIFRSHSVESSFNELHWR